MKNFPREDTIKFTDDDKKLPRELMPQWDASYRLSENILESFNEDTFSGLIETLSNKFYEELNSKVNEFIISDQTLNIRYYISNMVEQTVTALLSGEEWAMKAYPFSDYSKGEKIRKAVAVHGNDELLLRRIKDLEEELKNTKEQLRWARQ